MESTKIQGIDDKWLELLLEGLRKAGRLYMLKLPRPSLPSSADDFVKENLVEVGPEDISVTVHPYAEEVVVRAYWMKGGDVTDGRLYTSRDEAVEALMERLKKLLADNEAEMAALKAEIADTSR